MNDTIDTKPIYKKISLRLLPLLVICYTIAVIDRSNVGFAKFDMQSAIGLTEQQYGLAAGILYIGYVLFEIPSNLLLVKIGARKTLSRIMVLWGITSASTMFVRDAQTLYIFRVLLGIFEAGFAPGIIFYLTFWFPSDRMGRAMSIFMLAAPLSSVVGGPLAGFLLTYFDGQLGLAGWQWMFLLEGVPSIALGLYIFLTLPARPSAAQWLSDAEKKAVAQEVKDLTATQESFISTLADPYIHMLALSYFCLMCGLSFCAFWLPTLLRAVPHLDILHIGLYSAIPFLVAVPVMLYVGRRSDTLKERRWHCAVPAVIGAFAMGVGGYSIGSLLLTLVAMSVAVPTMYASYSVFWAIPADYLKGKNSSGGIAYINTIGLLGSFASPYAVGILKQHFNNLLPAMLTMCVLLLIGTVLIVSFRPYANVSTRRSRAIDSSL